MEELEDFVERLGTDVGAICGYPVQKSEKFRDSSYALRKSQASGKGNFAYIRRVKNGRAVPDRCFVIQVRERYATKAGVTHLANNHDDNGCHNEPARYWYATEGNTESYNRAVGTLSKICQVR